jgi:hypothetical protein
MMRVVGGPSRGGRVIGRSVVLFELGVLALVLASCGGDEPAPEPRSQPRATPSQLRSEPDAGDEQPISVPVGVRLTRGRTAVEPASVAAFLPLRFGIDNDTGRQAKVRIADVGTIVVARGHDGVLRSPGLPDGRIKIDGPGGSTTLRVKSGG